MRIAALSRTKSRNQRDALFNSSRMESCSIRKIQRLFAEMAFHTIQRKFLRVILLYALLL